MKKFSVILICIAGFCWGLIGVFSKVLSLAGFSAIQLTALRCLVTAISLGIYLLIFDRDKLKIRLRDIYYFIGTGIFSILFFNICYFSTVKTVSISVAAILLYTSPCIIMLLSSHLFGERLTPKKIVSLIMSFIGCVLVTGIATNQAIPIAGILTGLGSGLGYALYTIFSRYALKKYHPFTVTFYTFVIASAGIVLFTDLPQTFSLMSQSWTSVIFILLLGLVSTLTPFLCYTKGLEGVEAGTASIIACVEPLVATIAGIVIFKEQLTFLNTVGIILIFLAIVLINSKTYRAFEKSKTA